MGSRTRRASCRTAWLIGKLPAWWRPQGSADRAGGGMCFARRRCAASMRLKRGGTAMTIRDFTRRRVLRHTALLPLAAALPRVAVAQSPPLRLGVLTPLTGAGGFDGPRMLKAMQAVADELNGAGGLLNRHIELVVEDDQTNPDDAVR